MRIAIPVALACGAVLIAGCSTGSGSVDRHKVEKEVSDELTKTVGQRPKAIICPGDLKAVEGTKMRCKLEASDGSEIGLTLTVTSVKDNDVKFHIRVDQK
ncbi:MAG TPA: DUF4333 domain-containing protein [Streptosporangiaceae bacterium]